MSDRDKKFNSVLDQIERPTDNMAWLENATRSIAANKDRWAAEDAECEAVA